MLLSTVAAGALCVSAPRSAEAGPQACVVGPLNVVTCSGNQSGGIDQGVDFNAPPTNTLVISNLTQDIAPVGLDGVRWTASAATSITISSNTGPFAIRSDEHGFNIQSGIGATISLVHTGNIQAGAAFNGIVASSSSNNGDSGAVAVGVTGNIVSGSTGITTSSSVLTGDGNAGGVAVVHTGNIVTDGGIAVSATSTVFGGTGNAGAVSVETNGNLAGSISAGSSAANGNAGAVDVSHQGLLSDGGIIASSAVINDGNSGAINISNLGNIFGAIEAFSLVLGNGNSGAVAVVSAGNISGFINARSTVDGTGDAASVFVNNAGNISNASPDMTISAISRAADGDSGPVTVTSTGNLIGGTGIEAESRVVPGGTGNAGPVTVTSAGNITATGARAIIATSSTQDGNSGAVAVTSTGDLIGGIDALSFARGIGSTSGGVVVSSTGNINSSGVGIIVRSDGFGSANAVEVRSIGNITAGTGGIDASTLSATGIAGSLTVVSQGTIVAGTNGINAQSFSSTGSAGDVIVSAGNVQGRGSNGISARSVVTAGTGNSGNVTVDVAGNIAGAVDGIFAQSSSAGGAAGNIVVNLNGGNVSGEQGAGVRISGGANNLLSIFASASVSSLGSNTIVGDTGNEIVNNFGIVTGNVTLGSGNNLFTNFTGATFNAGSIVDLGATGLLANSGTLAPGGVGTAPITTALTGDFLQGAGGVFAVDVTNGAADRLNVSGTAGLSGLVRAMVTGLTSLTQQFTILSAAGGTTNSGITVQDTAIFDFELLFPNANDMVLAVTANFTPAGAALTPNQRVTAAHLQSALGAGGGNLGGLFGFLGGFLDVASFAKALDRLHPEPYLAPVQSALLANLGFTDSLMSCPTAASTDASVFIAEGQCAWARMGARQLNVDRTVENIGYKDKVWGGSAGVQFALAPNWFGSIALGYDRSDIKVDDRASGTGDLLHVGAAAKYIHGNWQISGALAGGHASYDLTRFGVMPGVNATGDLSLNFLSGRLRTAYVFGSDNAYVKPMLDIDAIGIWRGAVQETGAGPVGLNVRSQRDTLFSVAPAVEVGGQFAYANGLLRPFLRAGVRLFSEDDLKATASFIGSPTAAPAFTVTTPLDQWMGEVSTGLEMLGNDRYDARISYESRFGERTTQHGGSLKLRAKL